MWKDQNPLTQGVKKDRMNGTPDLFLLPSPSLSRPTVVARRRCTPSGCKCNYASDKCRVLAGHKSPLVSQTLERCLVRRRTVRGGQRWVGGWVGGQAPVLVPVVLLVVVFFG